MTLNHALNTRPSSQLYLHELLLVSFFIILYLPLIFIISNLETNARMTFKCQLQVININALYVIVLNYPTDRLIGYSY